MDAPFELTLYSEDRRIVIGGVPAMAVPVPGQTLLIHDLGGSSDAWQEVIRVLVHFPASGSRASLDRDRVMVSVLVKPGRGLWEE